MKARTQAACDASVADQMKPWRLSAEDAAVKAWRAVDSFTSLSAAELRQERLALEEIADIIKRAMEAIR